MMQWRLSNYDLWQIFMATNAPLMNAKNCNFRSKIVIFGKISYFLGLPRKPNHVWGYSRRVLARLFKIKIPETLVHGNNSVGRIWWQWCWWHRYIGVFNLSPLSQTCHQHISSPKSITNIHVKKIAYNF